MQGVGRCERCSVEFVATKNGMANGQRYCSKRCRNYVNNKAWKKRAGVWQGPVVPTGDATEIMCPLNWRTCKECGIEMLLSHGSTVRFCRECIAERNRMAGLDYYYSVRRPRDGYAQRSLTCTTCAGKFVGQGRKGRAYCSKVCALATRRNLTVIEAFSPQEIYQRDGLRCAICLKSLAMSRVVPHPDAPTIDHILPIVEGGVHSRANVRAAHFRCNSVRSNRGQAQLRMIG